MATTADPGVIELTAEEILTARGAAAAIIEAVDSPYMEIDDQFDPVRRDHLVAARAELWEALEHLAPEGTWRGRLPASEQQAIRDAIGAIEAMVTQPISARLQSLDYRATDEELDHLAAALDGVPQVDREDLAWSDFRFGGSEGALQRRSRWDDAMEAVRRTLAGMTQPQKRFRELRDFDPRRLHDASCEAIDRALIKQLAIAASLQNNRGYDFTAVDVLTALSSNVEAILDGDTHDHDCYNTDSKRRIRVARKRVDGAVKRADADAAQAHAFGAAQMVLWAESNRLREKKIGLR